MTNKVVELPIDLLSVDPVVQRALNPGRVRHLVRGFNPRALGAITVSARGNGKYVIIDGQHRWAAAIEAGYKGLVSVIVHEGMTLAQEARLFLELNDTKTVAAIDRFLVRVTAEDEVAVTLKGHLDRYELRVTGAPGRRHFAAVTALESVASVADITLWTLVRAWGGDRGSFEGSIVRGVGELFVKNGAQNVDAYRLSDVLAKKRPPVWEGLGKNSSEALQVSKAKGVAHSVATAYNRGVRKNRIEF